MNSDKAAAVRDSINGCPTVIGDDDLVESDREPHRTHSGDTLTGDRVESGSAFFRPAYIEQSGTFGDGDGREAPVFVVVLKSLWTEKRDVRSLSAEMVYEVAKHDCSIRFYPPDHRLDGDVWIVDHFAQDLSNTEYHYLQRNNHCV